MKTIKNNKITYLAAATLAVASLTVNSAQTVKADAVNNQNANSQDVTNKQTQQVTDQDVTDAQNKVENAQKTAESAKQDVANAQTKVDQAQKDYQQAQANKPAQTQDKALVDAKFDVTNKKQAVADAQTKIDQTQKQIVTQKQTVADKQKAMNTASVKADQENKNLTSMTNKQNADQVVVQNAQKTVNQDKAKTQTVQNHIAVSDSYKQAVKKYDQAYKDAMNNNKDASHAGIFAKDFDATMKKASADSFALSQFKGNDADKQIKVDLDHVTIDQQTELSKYAADLINDVRTQVGMSPVVVNTDAMNFANDVAKGYVADHRSIADGKHHDKRAINQAARDFGYDSDKTNSSQYYEDMAGFTTNADFVKNPTKAEDSGWYNQPAKGNPHITNMNILKEGIYEDLKMMFFNNAEWNHAFSLLGASQYTRNIYGRKVTTRFGLSTSILPKDNYISTHYLLLPDDMNMDKKHVLPTSDVKDEVKVDNSKEINEHLQALSSAQAELANQTKAVNLQQLKANEANKFYESAKADFAKAQTELTKLADALTNAKQDLTNKQNALQKAETVEAKLEKQIRKHDEAVKAYEVKLVAKKQAVVDAQTALDQAKAKFNKAQANVVVAKQNLTTITNIKKAQDLAKQDSDKSKGNIHQEGHLVNPAKPTQTGNHEAKPDHQDAKPTNQTEAKHDGAKTDHGSSVATDNQQKPNVAHDNDTQPVSSVKQDQVANASQTVADSTDTAKSHTLVIRDDFPALRNDTNIVNDDATPVVNVNNNIEQKVATMTEMSDHSYTLTINGQKLNFKNIFALLRYLNKQATGFKINFESVASLKKRTMTLDITNNSIRPIASILVPGEDYKIDQLTVINGKVYAHLADTNTWFDAEYIK